ncbi:uncharacterized protein [Miscanthus floridulus]|uniref:uncharacterized protein n=1 Tax=Miscanthus floridulus TaxID=154761 RepID=UPI00345ACF0E
MGSISPDLSGESPVMADPKGESPVMSDLESAGSISSDPEGVGSISPDPKDMGFASLDPQGLQYDVQILWPATNNEAEYEALLHGLRVAVSLGIKLLLVYGDSSVVINQVNKDWDCTKETMGAYCAEVCKLEKHFQGLENLHVMGDLNVVADALAKLGSDRA